MILKVIIDERLLELNAPEAFLDQADSFFRRMDRDMDQGWQMGREWVANPDSEQRCRIVADKLLNALEQENHPLGRLMTGYILRRMPTVETVRIDTEGEIQNTTFTLHETPPERPTPACAPADDKAEAQQHPGDASQQRYRPRSEGNE